MPHRVSILHVYTSKLHFVAAVTLDQLLYNLHFLGEEESRLERMWEGRKKVFKWRTLGLYRRWHGLGFPWRRRRQLRWRRRQRLGSGQRRWPCAGPWLCSTEPEGPSAGGRHPGESATSPRCRHYGGWVAHLSPERRQEERHEKADKEKKKG